MARATSQSCCCSPRVSPTASACSNAASCGSLTYLATLEAIAARSRSTHHLPPTICRLRGSSRTYPRACTPRSSAERSLSRPPGLSNPRGRFRRSNKCQREHGVSSGAAPYHDTVTWRLARQCCLLHVQRETHRVGPAIWQVRQCADHLEIAAFQCPRQACIHCRRTTPYRPADAKQDKHHPAPAAPRPQQQRGYQQGQRSWQRRRQKRQPLHRQHPA